MSAISSSDAAVHNTADTLAAAAMPVGRRVWPARSVHVAVGVLAFCCICWGLSFPIMQIASAAFQRDVLASGVWGTAADSGSQALFKLASSATFNGWRFTMAALIYWLLTHRRQRGYTRRDWVGGILVGLFLGGGMFMQLAGLQYALPSVSSFLTALTVVFAPLGQAWIFRQRVGRATWLAVGIAIVGIIIFSQPNPGAAAERTLAHRPPFFLLGEILTILGAVVFTAQILAVDRYGQSVDAVKLTTVSLATTGLVSVAGGIALGGNVFYGSKVMGLLAGDLTLCWSMLTLVLVCSAAAMHLMNIYQPRVSPAIASVIYCLEPVFGTLFSVLFRTERLTLITLAGGAIIMAAVLIVIHAAAQRGDASTPLSDAACLQ